MKPHTPSLSLNFSIFHRKYDLWPFSSLHFYTLCTQVFFGLFMLTICREMLAPWEQRISIKSANKLIEWIFILHNFLMPSKDFPYDGCKFDDHPAFTFKSVQLLWLFSSKKYFYMKLLYTQCLILFITGWI